MDFEGGSYCKISNNYIYHIGMRPGYGCSGGSNSVGTELYFIFVHIPRNKHIFSHISLAD